MKKLIRLGDHASKIGSGQTPLGGHASYQQSGIPFIRSQNVLMGDFSTEGLVYISEAQDKSMSGSRVLDDDVLLNITGASIGRVCVVPKNVCPGNVNQHVCIIRCSETLLPNYLSYVLASPKFQTFIWDSQSGGTRQALTKQMIENFEIPWVEVEDQTRVTSNLATQLAAVEEARQAAQAQLRDLKSLAIRLNEENIAMLNGFKSVTLGELLDGIETGKSFQTSERTASVNELGVLKVSAISWGAFNPQEAKAIDGSYTPEKKHRVCEGDVIISRANTVELVGAVVRVERDYPNRLLSDKTLRLLLDTKRCDADYIVQVLRLPEARAHLEGNATGSSDSMRNISQGTLRATPIPLPSLQDQQQFSKKMLEVEKALNGMRTTIQQQLRDLELLPSRLLAAVFDAPAAAQGDE